MDLEALKSRIAEAGFIYRGAFHPEPADLPPVLLDGSTPGTLVLVGFAGAGSWRVFAASAEAGDGRPDALDRWSARVVGDVALAVGASACFPFDGPPWRPFQRWARKAEPLHPSPLGVLIHPDWGLWHAYRGALAFAERVTAPPPALRPNPCETCPDKPCLSACPAEAYAAGGFDAARCAGHIGALAGGECMGAGCRARRACPVGADQRYGQDQARFHMRAFRDAHRPREGA